MKAIRDQFARLVEGPEDGIDIVDAALLIARTAFPDLSAARYTGLLDQWTDRLRRQVGPSASAGEVLSAMNHLLFEEEGLRGDVHNYFDPQNSFLNRVLDRKLGIPITLSIVYSEVGRRAGFPVYGIALPGHFITGLFHTSGTLYIDPFNQGTILTESECRRMVEARYGGKAALGTGWNHPADKKMILIRLLRNLKAICRHLGQDLQAFEMIQWILAIDPRTPTELKERGLLYEAMGNHTFALRDLEHYLELSPEPADRELVDQKINFLRQSQHRMH
jgi:regulator of sirC expression with transglutaminase-like and TPR domain